MWYFLSNRVLWMRICLSSPRTDQSNLKSVSIWANYSLLLRITKKKKNSVRTSKMKSFFYFNFHYTPFCLGMRHKNLKSARSPLLWNKRILPRKVVFNRIYTLHVLSEMRLKSYSVTYHHRRLRWYMQQMADVWAHSKDSYNSLKETSYYYTNFQQYHLTLTELNLYAGNKY